MSEASSWSDTSPRVADGRQDVVAVSVRSEQGLVVMGELMSGWLISYQGNWQRCMRLTAPLITVTSWGLRQVYGKISPVGSM